MNKAVRIIACGLVGIGFLLHLSCLLFGGQYWVGVRTALNTEFAGKTDGAMGAMWKATEIAEGWTFLLFIFAGLMLVGAIILERQLRSAQSMVKILQEQHLSSGSPTSESTVSSDPSTSGDS